MKSDASTPISIDYLVELSDDGKEPEGQEPEVLILPPRPEAKESPANAANTPRQEPPDPLAKS